MPKTPFVLMGRNVVEGGLELIFRCAECCREISLRVDDGDALDGRYPVACPCGTEVNMYFGAPMVSRMLLRKLRATPDPRDSFRRSSQAITN